MVFPGAALFLDIFHVAESAVKVFISIAVIGGGEFFGGISGEDGFHQNVILGRAGELDAPSAPSK